MCLHAQLQRRAITLLLLLTITIITVHTTTAYVS
jgi:hypothetical protein